MVSYFIARGMTSTRPSPRRSARAARSGAVTCVGPSNAAMSQTSLSVGATLKSPSTAYGWSAVELGGHRGA